MRLSLCIIREHLLEKYKCKQFGPDEKGLSLPRPVFYLPGGPLLPGSLYVAGINSLPQESPPEDVFLICAGSRIPLEWMASGCQILLVSGAEPLELFNEVHAIFNKFDQWDYALSEAIGRDSDFDLKELLHLGVLILENPLFVIDASLQVNFSSEISNGQITVSDVPYPLTPESREIMKESCKTERLLTGSFVSRVQDQYETYCQNLFLMEHFIGSVWLESQNRPMRDGDYLLADHFFSFFIRGYRRYIRSLRKTETPMAAALRKLLEHIHLTEEESEVFSLADGEYWHCFRLREKSSSHSMPGDYMLATLNTMMPKDVCAAILHGEIVGILRLSVSNAESTLSFFRDLLNRMDYAAGLGNGFRSMQDFSESLMEAGFVAERGVSSNENQIVHFFQEHLLSYMLYECSGKLLPEALYSRGLSALIAYDRQKNTEYLKTLDVYLKNETSISRTSEQLFIHRTSLLKRLSKIEKITGEDLTSPDTRLYYRISIV